MMIRKIKYKTEGKFTEELISWIKLNIMKILFMVLFSG